MDIATPWEDDIRSRRRNDVERHQMNSNPERMWTLKSTKSPVVLSNSSSSSSKRTITIIEQDLEQDEEVFLIEKYGQGDNKDNKDKSIDKETQPQMKSCFTIVNNTQKRDQVQAFCNLESDNKKIHIQQKEKLNKQQLGENKVINHNDSQMTSTVSVKHKKEEILSSSSIAESLIREHICRHFSKDVTEVFASEMQRPPDGLTSSVKLAKALNLENQYKENKVRGNQYLSVLELFVHSFASSTIGNSAVTDEKILQGKTMNSVFLKESNQGNLETNREKDATGQKNTIANSPTNPLTNPITNISTNPTTNLNSKAENSFLEGINKKKKQKPKKSILKINILKCKPLNKPKKTVNVGNSGSTPKKEYIFFVNTPPSFVTETLEDAIEVFNRLDGDPKYDLLEEMSRFVELNSSDVAKYTVGMRVSELGPKGDISGIVHKKLGSKLCGTAGPGTVIIDTSVSNEKSPVEGIL